MFGVLGISTIYWTTNHFVLSFPPNKFVGLTFHKIVILFLQDNGQDVQIAHDMRIIDVTSFLKQVLTKQKHKNKCIPTLCWRRTTVCMHTPHADTIASNQFSLFSAELMTRYPFHDCRTILRLQTKRSFTKKRKKTKLVQIQILTSILDVFGN